MKFKKYKLLQEIAKQELVKEGVEFNERNRNRDNG